MTELGQGVGVRAHYPTYKLCNQMGMFFCGNVVLDSINKISRDEDNFLDQTYKNKCVRIIVMMILILNNILRKCILPL